MISRLEQILSLLFVYSTLRSAVELSYPPAIWRDESTCFVGFGDRCCMEKRIEYRWSRSN